MVQSYLADKFGEKSLQEGGLKVYTTLDPKLQSIAEQAIKDGVEKNSKKYNGHNGALVAIDPKTGQILAMVGSKDYFGKSEPEGCKPGKNCLFEPNVNVAISERQPGSSFKPFIYVTAFGKDFKFSPASMLMDVVTNFGKYGNKDYVPENYDGKERGPLSIRQSLAGSLNIPAVKTLALIGVENAVQTARNLGITSPLQNCGLSLVLGGCEVKLLDHVAAYSVLANNGVKNEKTAILKILDKDGRTLEEFQSAPKEILDPKAVYLVTNIMTDNNARSYIFGAHSPLILENRPVAAKTGTSQKWHDGWAMGFTPSLATGVWVGNNDGTFLKEKADGVLVAAPIWNAFMKEALKDTPVEEFKRPEGIVDVVVDEVSGKLPTAYTLKTKSEIFADYHTPLPKDNIHIAVSFDSLTNLPSTDTTPPERKIYKPYTIFHSEQPDNPEWETPINLWAKKNGYIYPPKDAQIISPPSQTSEQGPKIEILEPSEGQIISHSPFVVKINTSSNHYITQVEISIDGETIDHLTTEPFVFSVSKKLALGKHTLAVKATNGNGGSTDTSLEFNFQP
jgi:membrane peptidoglycan carboxypeptidase